MKLLKQITRKSHLKQILLLGIPLLAGRLSHYFHHVTDSIMMGHYKEGSIELGALAIAGLFIWMISTLLWPLGNGVQAIVTRRAGKEGTGMAAFEQTGIIMDNGLVISLCAGVIAVLITFLAGPLLGILIEDERIIALALDYIGLIRLSLIPFGLQMILQRFFSSIKKTRYVMIAAIISNLLNVVLNYIFIFGKLGAPEMGIRGAALGTVLSQYAGFFYMLLVALKMEYLNKYKYLRFQEIKWEIIRNILRISTPPAIQNMMAFFIVLLYESMVERVSPIYLAATHVAFSAFRINKTLVGGFAHGASILVGNALGAGKEDEAKSIVKSGYITGLAVGVLVFFLAFFSPDFLARIFTNSTDALDSVSRAFRFFAPFYFIEIIGFTLEMVFIGNGWGKFVLFSEFTTNFTFILGFSLLMNLLFPGNIALIWLGFGLYQVVHSGILHYGLRSGKWLKVKVEK
ncbi:MAG: MATE family efflux transporter [Spirochaetales bacterium]|nr:MATE family efflux transporter [Spirochaetales bacterium]